LTATPTFASKPGSLVVALCVVAGAVGRQGLPVKSDLTSLHIVSSCLIPLALLSINFFLYGHGLDINLEIDYCGAVRLYNRQN
jgi:hypothetical protein